MPGWNLRGWLLFSLHHRDYKHKNYFFSIKSSILCTSLNHCTKYKDMKNIAEWYEKKPKMYGHTMWITWLLFYMLCKQYDMNELIRIPVFEIFSKLMLLVFSFYIPQHMTNPCLKEVKLSFIPLLIYQTRT